MTAKQLAEFTGCGAMGTFAGGPVGMQASYANGKKFRKFDRKKTKVKGKAQEAVERLVSG